MDSYFGGLCMRRLHDIRTLRNLYFVGGPLVDLYFGGLCMRRLHDNCTLVLDESIMLEMGEGMS